MTGRVFIAMEYVEGRSMRDAIDEGPLPAERVRAIGIQVAGALRAAHATGTQLASASTSTAGLTADGRLVGTPGYMSPEQVSGDPLDGRSDLFSLGVTLYEALSGRQPFRGKSPIDVLIATSRDAQPALQTLAPDALASLVTVIERLLNKEPADRHASSDALMRALRDESPRATDATRTTLGPGTLRWLVGAALLAAGVALYLFIR